MKVIIKTAVALSLLALLSACATKANPDPIEKFNRGVYSFNSDIDKAIIKPVAKVYNFILPTPIRSGVRHAYNNLEEVPTFINDVLQFKFKRAATSLGRFALNSTVGVAGLFEVADGMGLKRHHEDFGQTLGYWGYENSAYLVLPILGPSTIRDTVGLVGTHYMSPQAYVGDDSFKRGFYALKAVSRRADLLDKEKAFKAAAVDEYVAVRNAYLQNRDFVINDGQAEDTGADLEGY